MVRDTVGMIAESEREVEAAARQVENIIKRERRAIAEFEQRSSAQVANISCFLFDRVDF